MKKSKKKSSKYGFTLIELLMVIGMISVLLIIFMPTLLGIGDDVRRDTYSNKITLVETAAENFIEDKKNYIKGGNDLCVSVQYLIEKGYLTSEGNDGSYMINPLDDTQMVGSIKLEYVVENGIGKSKATYMADTMCQIALEDDISSDRYATTDNEAPKGNSLLIDDGASTTGSLYVRLNITNESGTATGMCIKNELNNGSLNVNDNCEDFMWKAYTPIYNNWELLDDENEFKNVYVWLRNSNRKATTEPVTDNIHFVVGVPKITFDPINNTSYQKDAKVKFTVTSYATLTDVRYSWIKSTDEIPQYLGNVTNINPNGKKYEQTVSGDQTGIHRLCVSARNDADFETTVCSDEFYLDITSPTITIESSNVSKKVHTPTITAVDNNAGIDSIKYLWTATNNTSAKNGTTITSGSKAITPSNAPTNGTMYLCVYAIDNASNESNQCSPFIFDTTLPTISVSPSSTTSVKNLSVTITARDTYLYSGNSYQYYLSTSSTSLIGGSWLNYTSGSSFTLGSGLTGTYYLFIKQIRDVAGNLSSTTNNVNISSITYHRFGTFIFDNTLPTVTASPSSGSAAKNRNVTINVSDTYLYGSNSYQYYLSTSSTSLTGGRWLNYTRGTSFNIGSGLTGTYYLFVKRVRDVAGNYSSINNVTINSVVYHRFGSYVFDNTPPVIYSFYINNNASVTTSTYVTLNSNVGGSPTQMCFSNTTSCSNWVTYSASYGWYINGSTTSTVYAWYRDAVGNTTSRTYDSITYQPAIYPSGSITINNGAWSTTSTYVSLQISAYNATGMCISTSGYCSSFSSIRSSSSIYISGYQNQNNYVYIQFVSSTGHTSTALASIYYNVPQISAPVITISPASGGWVPARTTVTITCSSYDAPITYFESCDDSNRFGAHPNPDCGNPYWSGSTGYNSIMMASASSSKCWGSCTYRIDATCTNSAGKTTNETFYYEVGLTN